MRTPSTLGEHIVGCRPRQLTGSPCSAQLLQPLGRCHCLHLQPRMQLVWCQIDYEERNWHLVRTPSTLGERCMRCRHLLPQSSLLSPFVHPSGSFPPHLAGKREEFHFCGSSCQVSKVPHPDSSICPPSTHVSFAAGNPRIL